MHTSPATTTTIRPLTQLVHGMPATDGAGVELTRVIGQPALNMLDPFLLLDAFRSDNPQDYIAGFPLHPHRGFETVTYLLAGKMRHKDNANHEGVIEPGGIQWMSAGRGIAHSEMPEQENGLLEGFQLWINLPAAHKMDAPKYQEFTVDQIPIETRNGGVTLKVIAGQTTQGTLGPIVQPFTQPCYFDVTIPAKAHFSEALPTGHNAFVYVIDGAAALKDSSGQPVTLHKDDLAVLGAGDRVQLHAAENASSVRLLLLAGKPLREPVARGGPFVMNSKDEILQAFDDYAKGRFDD